MAEMEFSGEQLRRFVIQRLEDAQRAGMTHWKRVEPAKTVAEPLARQAVGALAAAVEQKASNVALDEKRVAVDARIASDALSTSTVTRLPATSVNLFGDNESSVVPKKAPAPPPVPCSEFKALNLPLAERVAGLKSLAERVAQCTRCHELATTRTQTVFGVGNPQAKIMFIGEAPGADEDAKGEPFVGRAGQLLNDIIKACRLKREDIYICNVLRCRPPGNRLPAPEEAANCREYLDGQIAHVNPEYIVCWGACAAQNLLGVTESIGKLRGQFRQYGTARVLCTYHPSYLLRNPAAKKDVWDDMKLLFQDMGVDLSAKK